MPPSHESRASVFLRHRRRIEGLVARVLNDVEEARDVVSEAFVALLERGPEQVDATASWLTRSAINRAIDRLRVRDRARDRAHLTAQQLAAPDEPDRVGRDQMAELVRRALARLSPREQRALQLRHASGASYENIGVSLGTTAGHARVIVHRAAKRLRGEVVILLARHHGATDACTRRLLDDTGPPHHDCAPCAAVADELAAMATPALQPALGAALTESIIARIGRLLHAPAIPRSPAAGRVAEALAVLALVASLGAQPYLTAADTAHVSPRGRTIGAVLSHPQPRALGPFVAGGAVRQTRRLVQHDSPIRAPLRGVRDSLGVPVFVSDVVDTNTSAMFDLRRVEIVTLIRDGAPEAVRLRLVLGAAPNPAEQFMVLWKYPHTKCTAAVAASGAEGALLRSTCRQRPYVHQDDRELPIAMSTHRNVVDFVVRFADLRGRPAQLFAPGARLHEIIAMTQAATLVGWTGDTAPDPDAPQLRYRIAR